MKAYLNNVTFSVIPDALYPCSCIMIDICSNPATIAPKVYWLSEINNL